MNKAQAYVNYVQNTINMTVGDEDGYPVTSTILVQSNVANRKTLDILEEGGFIKAITIDVPSVLVPGETVKEKAYYTEGLIPKYVKELQ